MVMESRLFVIALTSIRSAVGGCEGWGGWGVGFLETILTIVAIHCNSKMPINYNITSLTSSRDLALSA